MLYWLERILRGHHTSVPLEGQAPALTCFVARSGRSGTPAAFPGQDRSLTLQNTGRAGGCGLPIGSLTSQHLANFYLGKLDRFCQELPGVKSFVRYMDDFVCWADDKAALLAAGRRIERFAEDELGLVLKDATKTQEVRPELVACADVPSNAPDGPCCLHRRKSADKSAQSKACCAREKARRPQTFRAKCFYRLDALLKANESKACFSRSPVNDK